MSPDPAGAPTREPDDVSAVDDRPVIPGIEPGSRSEVVTRERSSHERFTTSYEENLTESVENNPPSLNTSYSEGLISPRRNVRRSTQVLTPPPDSLVSGDMSPNSDNDKENTDPLPSLQ